MKPAKRRRIDVNLDELDRVLDGARQAPLSEADCDKLKNALHALAAMLAPSRNTEKTSTVLEEPEKPETSDGAQPDTNVSPQPGTRAQRSEGVWGCADGRHCAPEVDAWGPLPRVRKRQRIRPEGSEGTGADRRPGTVGSHSLLAGAVAMRRVRAGVYQEPEGVCPEKYDETAAGMIAQLKYGSGRRGRRGGETGAG